MKPISFLNFVILALAKRTAILITFLVFGCQHESLFSGKKQAEPTKVYGSEQAELKPAAKTDGAPITKFILPADTTVVDARSAFEFGLSHIPGAVNVRWDEFTQSSEPFKGVFEGDMFYHARRLARLGIGPDTKIIVVGRGRKGHGEEGRVAWTLKYLGVKNVQFMGVDAFKRPTQIDNEPPRHPASVWKPEFDESLLVTKEQVKSWLTGDAEAGLSARPSADFQMLDVDVGPPQKMVRPSPFDRLSTISIPWTDFITSRGAIDTGVKARLSEIGLDSQKQILVISHRGIESGPVVLALRELGFEKVALLSGGYSALLDTGAGRKPLK